MWAGELTPSDPELDARIAARAAALVAETRELATLRGWAAEQDVLQSAELRLRRALGFSVLVAAIGGAGGAALRAGWFALGFLELGLVHLVVGLLAFGFIAAGWRRENQATRRLAQVMLVATISPFVALATAWRLGLDAEVALVIDSLVKAGGSAVLGVFVERSFVGVATLYVLTAAALLAFPGTFPFEIAAAGLVLCLLHVARGLRQPKPEAMA